jgi:hypothetical protein
MTTPAFQPCGDSGCPWCDRNATVPASPFREVCARAQRTACDYCKASPGESCDTPLPGGLHVARWGRAYREGLLVRGDYAAVYPQLLRSREEFAVLVEATALHDETPGMRS